MSPVRSWFDFKLTRSLKIFIHIVFSCFEKKKKYSLGLENMDRNHVFMQEILFQSL